jgi:alanine-alpha-ketoisovalerate/valine-pyruvate aminotransferase
MDAINSNAMLSLMFGNSLEGAMAVAELLKQRNSQRIYEKVLEPFAERVESKELSLLKNGTSSVSFDARSTR